MSAFMRGMFIIVAWLFGCWLCQSARDSQAAGSGMSGNSARKSTVWQNKLRTSDACTYSMQDLYEYMCGAQCIVYPVCTVLHTANYRHFGV